MTDSQVIETRATTIAAVETAAIEILKLAELLAGDRQFANDLLEVYSASSAHILNEMRVSVAGDDRHQLQRAAHKLKGASANICAPMLHDLCSVLETAVRDSTTTDTELSASVERIAVAIEQTRQGLLKFIDGMSS